jgi:hypothetical protein
MEGLGRKDRFIALSRLWSWLTISPTRLRFIPVFSKDSPAAESNAVTVTEALGTIFRWWALEEALDGTVSKELCGRDGSIIFVYCGVERRCLRALSFPLPIFISFNKSSNGCLTIVVYFIYEESALVS